MQDSEGSGPTVETPHRRGPNVAPFVEGEAPNDTARWLGTWIGCDFRPPAEQGEERCRHARARASTILTAHWKVLGLTAADAIEVAEVTSLASTQDFRGTDRLQEMNRRRLQVHALLYAVLAPAAPTVDHEANARALKMTLESDRLIVRELVDLCGGPAHRVGTEAFRFPRKARRALVESPRLRDLVDDAGEGVHHRFAPNELARRVAVVLSDD